MSGSRSHPSVLRRARRPRPVLALAFCILCCATSYSYAGEPKPQDTLEAMGRKWRQDARAWREQAKEAGLDEAEIEQLGRDGLVIAGPQLLQSFEPYFGTMPVFVTSDAVLNAFHVLLEESLVGVEHANARRLRTMVHGLRDGLDRPPFTIEERPELTTAALRRARLTVGVALALLGASPRVLEAERALVEDEVARVRAARAVSKPSWLGPPDPGFLAIDYSRFRPRGFHAGDPVLERAFRAREWLQSIPLRPERDEELVMFALLHEIDSRNNSYWSRPVDTAGLLGAEDDVSAISFNNGSSLKGATELSYLRRLYTSDRNFSRTSDQIRATSNELTFRIISTSRVPDADQVFDRDPLRRTLPSGLELAAALGSTVAAGTIEGGASLLGRLRSPNALKGFGSYGAYLDTLAALLDAPDPEAPPVFAGRPWQSKSCGAVLSGWAQMRHALSSHVRESGVIGGIGPTPSGFVEPNPVFFSRLADLAETMRSSLESAGAFGVEPSLAAAELRRDVSYLEYVMRPGTKADEYQLNMAVGRVAGDLRNAGERVPDRTPAIVLNQARRLLARPVKDAGDPVEKREGLRDLWYQLALVSRRLEALAHSQLRHRTPSLSDEAFLQRIGEELAHIMLYENNLYEAPKDDAPRVIDVATDHQRGMHLEVGIARPRTLYLLYPWDGRDVLTRGAYLPYREFTSSARLTNEEWRKQLDQRVPPPTACTSAIEIPARPKPQRPDQ